MQLKRIRSKITGIEYDPTPNKEVVYVGNIEQFTRYMANGGDDYFIDMFFDRHNGKNKMTFVFLRNEYTKLLYERWNNYILPKE